MHGAMRSMSISTGHATAGGSGTSNELSNSMDCLTRFFLRHCPRKRAIQYLPSECLRNDTAYWMPAFAGMTAEGWRISTSCLHPPCFDQLQQLVRRNRGLGDPHPERRQGVLDR